MADFKHVGTVEILRSRIYNLDPYADPNDLTATTVIVEPGSYPLVILYSQGGGTAALPASRFRVL